MFTSSAICVFALTIAASGQESDQDVKVFKGVNRALKVQPPDGVVPDAFVVEPNAPAAAQARVMLPLAVGTGLATLDTLAATFGVKEIREQFPAPTGRRPLPQACPTFPVILL